MARYTFSTLQLPPHGRVGRYFSIFLLLSLLLGIFAGMGVVVLGQPALILLAVIGLAIFVGAVVSTEFGLLILVFLAYTRLSDIAVHRFDAPSVAKLFIPLLIGAILARWVFNNEPPRGWEKVSILLGIYGLVGFGSILYAPDPSRVLYTMLAYAKDAIIAVVVVILLHSPRTFHKVVWCLLAIGIFLGTISIFQYVTHTYQNDYWGFASANIQTIVGQKSDYRAAGPIGDPNYFAQVMVVLVPMALERFLHEKRLLLRGLALWALVAALFSVLLTYSRGGFLALGVAVISFFILYPPKISFIPVGIVLALVLASLAPPSYFDRILSVNELFNPSGSLYVQDLALRGRTSENLAAVEMIKEHPLFGVGLSNFSLLFNEYSRESGLALVATERAAHNLYLEVLAETGIVGIAVFLFILSSSFKSLILAWRTFQKTNHKDYAGLTAGFAMGLLGYLIAAFFIHNAYPRYFYLLIGLALSCEMVARNHLQELRERSRMKTLVLPFATAEEIPRQ